MRSRREGNSPSPMSAFGTKRISRHGQSMSAFGSKADMNQTSLKADINTAVGFWCAPCLCPGKSIPRNWHAIGCRDAGAGLTWQVGRRFLSCRFSRRCTGSLNGTLPFQLCQRGSEAAQPPVVRCDIGSAGRPFALAPRGHRIYALSHLPVSYSGHHKLR